MTDTQPSNKNKNPKPQNVSPTKGDNTDNKPSERVTNPESILNNSN